MCYIKIRKRNMRKRLLVIASLFSIIFSMASCGGNFNSDANTSSDSSSQVSVAPYVNIKLYCDEYSTTDPYSTTLYHGEQQRVDFYNWPGYEFVGYYTQRNGAGELVSNKQGMYTCYLNAGLSLSNNTSLYGAYKIATYTIHYECNIGTPTGENPTSYTKDTPTFTLYPYQEVGYTFKGWYTYDGTLVSAIYQGSNKNYYLYGKMERSVVNVSLSTLHAITVTYYVKNEVYLSSQMYEGEKVNVPENPSVTGYIFLGWYFEKECTNRCTFSTVLTQDTSLYACFIEKTDENPILEFNQRTAITAPLIGYSTYRIVTMLDQTATLSFSSGHLKYSLSSSIPVVPLTWANPDTGNSVSLSINTVYYLTIKEDSEQDTTYYLTVQGEANYTSSSRVGTLSDTQPLYQMPVTYGLSFTLQLPNYDSKWKEFKGWYTLENGQGEQITDSSGQSLEVSTFLEDLTLYPYLISK